MSSKKAKTAKSPKVVYVYDYITYAPDELDDLVATHGDDIYVDEYQFVKTGRVTQRITFEGK